MRQRLKIKNRKKIVDFFRFGLPPFELPKPLPLFMLPYRWPRIIKI